MIGLLSKRRTSEWFVRYNKLNITFSARMIVENIIPRNMIINLGCASVDIHIPRDDIFDYHPRRECNIKYYVGNIAKQIYVLYVTLCRRYRNKYVLHKTLLRHDRTKYKCMFYITTCI